MSINNYIDELDDAARYALAKAGAITVCPLHSATDFGLEQTC